MDEEALDAENREWFTTEDSYSGPKNCPLSDFAHCCQYTRLLVRTLSTLFTHIVEAGGDAKTEIRYVVDSPYFENYRSCFLFHVRHYYSPYQTEIYYSLDE